MAGPSLEANVQPLERELIIYEKGIPELLELDTPLYQMIDKEEADPASNRATRIPLLVSIGGTFQQVSMDGGSLGITGGPSWQVATLTPIYFTSGYSYTLLAKYATTGGARGVKSTTGEVMRLSIKQFKTYLDMVMNTAGNGVIGTITSAGPPLTLTTDGFKEELAMVGQNVQVYNAALTTNRGSGNITAIDRINHTITLDANPGGTTGTDLLVIGGLTGTLTAQSSLFGIQYHQSDATSGTWLNLNRATFSTQIVTPSVNAGSSALTTGMIRGALNRIRINLGDDFFNLNKTKMVAYSHPSQADSYESLAITISAIWKDPTGNQDVDLMFNNQEGLKMSNVPVRQSIHQDRTRIDFLCLGYWGRIVGVDTGFVKFGDQILWPLVDTVTGSLKATEQFWLNTGLQLYNRNPLSGSYIKSLSLPLIGASSIY